MPDLSLSIISKSNPYHLFKNEAEANQLAVASREKKDNLIKKVKYGCRFVFIVASIIGIVLSIYYCIDLRSLKDSNSSKRLTNHSITAHNKATNYSN